MVNYGGAQYSGAYGTYDVYGAAASGGGYGAASMFAPLQSKQGAMMVAPPGRKRRLNVVAICLNVFVPWLIFCLVASMLSFEMHYAKPETVQAVIIVILALAVLVGSLDVAYLYWKRQRGEGNFANATWLLFLCVCVLVAVGLAVPFGNRNFWANSQIFFDITALNSYNGVDPSRMRGQELMDAGRVLFANGTHLDLSRSMGFRNVDTYCVAPITGGAVVGNPLLASYDFWAVGKDCCSSNSADFRCGEYNNAEARAGMRLMRDSDRAFFRLAVQQAESAYGIKATHPLFFHWVRDPVAETYQYQQSAFQMYTVGMFGYFVLQVVLVFIGASVFSKFA
mmetsp:Transcript_122139/g.353130  ORF Transcript_122139/g.353130 Transcript_122139/m.353130 type:complete len:338 (+) Transcript_122139:95-1108(+)|eukprot:CAMPEP_0176108936 /NCGR_PEP_ID=MMETSP0120_2-20121206/54690_1 /TAXON_ID=160619 /ORGANISM="Kryptoperidinium foliaceum, Strain CCMP 1326" /LENGTH=337 /DNA_ID=CAMNT_0017443113 /DNA_START=71 /DNA_END=1084 /DNA_ORIENTATION=+